MFNKLKSQLFSKLTLAVLIFLCLPVQAKDAVDLYSLSLRELSQIEISTGTQVTLNEAPAVATLITADDIQALGALTFDEVLETIPGLHVIPSTLNRMLPVYTFRGLYEGQNQQVMFMMNGHRIDGDLYASGLTHAANMSVSHIARIEVVRGPGSAIYGADAYSGVINIITKSAEQLDGAHFGARIGSQHTRNYWLQYGKQWLNEWQLALNLEYLKRNSNKERTVESDFQSAFDGLFGSDASLAPSYLDDRMESFNYNVHLNNHNWRLGVDGYVKRDSGVGAGAAQTIDHQGRDLVDSYLLSLAYKDNSSFKLWSIEGQLSYFYYKSRPEFTIFPAGAVLPIGNDGNAFTPHDGSGCLTANIPGIGCLTIFSEGFKGNPASEAKIPTLDLIAHYSGASSHQLRFNIGIKQEQIHGNELKNFGPGVLDKASLQGEDNPVVVDGALTSVENTPYNFVPDETRTVRYLSFQDIWQINNDLTLTSGLRYDHYSDVGNTINPRLALVWNTSEQLVTKLLYGRAFRAPSFSELYSRNNPVSLGNKDLQPETINTTELSFHYQLADGLQANFNIYHYRTKDMIKFITNAEGVGDAQNHRSLVGKGVELELNWQPTNSWQLKSHYAYQSTKDRENDRQVEFVPQQQIYLDSRWQLKQNWLLSAQVNYIKDRARATGDMRKPIDDYQLVNVSLRRMNIDWGSTDKNWSIAATIKNLFDSDVREPSDGRIVNDYPMHDRRIYLELNYRL